MSRLEVNTPGKGQAIVEQLYRNMERRIAASPPGLCPVDMALNFLNLCQAQTCGKCVPCRVGLAQLSDMLREVLDGDPDINILHRIEVTARRRLLRRISRTAGGSLPADHRLPTKSDMKRNVYDYGKHTLAV